MSENQIEIIGNRDVELLEKNRKINIQKLFTPEGMDAVIKEIEGEVDDFLAFHAAPETKQGRASIVSMAAKIAKCKKPIKDLSMEAKEESRKFIDGVQEQWNRYEAKINEFHAKVRKPVDEIEEKEAAELKARQDRLAEIEKFRFSTAEKTSNIIEAEIKAVRQLFQFDWGDDWIFRAETALNEVVAFLEGKLAAAQKYEADQVELAELRKKNEERDRKDREDQIAKDAAENARKQEEERIKKIEEDKRIAEEKLVIEARKTFLVGLGFVQDVMTGDFIFKGSKSYAKIAGREFLTKDGEAWGKTMIQAEEFVKNILQENEEFAKAEEKRIADEATEKERLRADEEKRKEDEATEKREKNKRHRAKINNEAATAIAIILAKSDKTLTEAEQETIMAQVKSIIQAIAKGEVPHIQINY